MTRITLHQLTTATAMTAVLALSATAAVPRWKILKPSNTGVPGDTTLDIAIGPDGKPWIPGYIPFWEEGGMSRFDMTTNTWFAVTNVDYPEIVSPRFYDIDTDANGIMWIGSDDGLLRYDPQADTIVRYDQYNTPMPGDQIGTVSIAPDGSLWLAIANAGETPPGGLVRFDPAADTWDVWTTANGLPWGNDYPGWDWVDYAAAAPDADGGYTVYFGSMEMGASSYKDGVFTWFQDEPTIPLIWGIASDDPVDDLGNCWLSTDLGLYRRDPDGTMNYVGAPESGAVEAFSGGRAGLRTSNGNIYIYDGSTWTYIGAWGGAAGTYALAEESPGVYWAGGVGGAARYSEGSWQRYRLTNTGMLSFFISTLDFGPDGKVYVDANAGPGVGGFDIFDGERWTCVNDLNYGLGPAWGQPSDHVEVLCARSNGKLALDWDIGGLHEWNGESYISLNGQWNTFALGEDTLGRLWSGTSGNLFLYDGGGYTTFDTSNSPMLDFDVKSIETDHQNPGFIYAATGLGVVHTDGVTWNVYPREMIGLSEWTIGHFIGYAQPAADGTIWLGTGLGLYHFDPATGHYDNYTPANSTLPSDDIAQIEVTPDGSVWATTFDQDFPYPGGLTRFDGFNWTTWTMTDSPLPHNQTSVMKSRETATGYELWVGTASEGIAVLTVETVPSCPADLDGDAEVGFADVLRVIGAWGPCPPGACDEDINGNGNVDFADILAVIGAWGPCP
ncbi:MAG: hypothetical protein ACYTGP_01065 [Planctomycetota bacterium]|jgi:hypothetical protein